MDDSINSPEAGAVLDGNTAIGVVNLVNDGPDDLVDDGIDDGTELVVPVGDSPNDVDYGPDDGIEAAVPVDAVTSQKIGMLITKI